MIGRIVAPLAAALALCSCASAPKPFLWKIEKGGRESWLLGTLHAGATVADLAPAVRQKLGASGAFVAEIDARPDPQKNHPDLELAPSSPNLDELLSKEAWARLQARLLGAPVAKLRRMSPFFAMYLLDDLERRENAGKAKAASGESAAKGAVASAAPSAAPSGAVAGGKAPAAGPAAGKAHRSLKAKKKASPGAAATAVAAAPAPAAPVQGAAAPAPAAPVQGAAAPAPAAPVPAGARPEAPPATEAGAPSMDESLLAEARSRGMVISYLEEKTPELRACIDRTVARDLEEKLMPKPVAPAGAPVEKDEMTRVSSAYFSGDLRKIAELEAEEEKDMGQTAECSIEQRNRAWAEKIERLHEVYAPLFIAVGVGHMATKADTLLQSLKAVGFSVERTAR